MKYEIAQSLLEIGAVSLKPEDPYTWSSGMKSPIYCDNRLTLSFPQVRKQIATGLKGIIEKEFPGAEVIAGTATAGIPHAAWVSDMMDLPMSYVRSSAKGHGKGNQIEGKVVPGQKVVVVEDLISTGGSAISAAEALREAGAEVLGVAAIFTYELEKGKNMFADADLKAVALSDYTALVEMAVKLDKIKETDMARLSKWRENPQDESWMNS